MPTQAKNIFVERRKLKKCFTDQYRQNQKCVATAIAGTKVELRIRVTPPEIPVGYNRKNQKIVECPCPYFGAFRRHTTSEDRAGDMEAKRPIAERRTGHPAAHLTDNCVG